METGGLLPGRQIGREPIWTALAGRIAANPMDGVSNEYSEAGSERSHQFGFSPSERPERCEGDGIKGRQQFGLLPIERHRCEGDQCSQ